jgi:hypothetical protein
MGRRAEVGVAAGNVSRDAITVDVDVDANAADGVGDGRMSKVAEQWWHANCGSSISQPQQRGVRLLDIRNAVDSCGTQCVLTQRPRPAISHTRQSCARWPDEKLDD